MKSEAVSLTSYWRTNVGPSPSGCLYPPVRAYYPLHFFSNISPHRSLIFIIFSFSLFFLLPSFIFVDGVARFNLRRPHEENSGEKRRETIEAHTNKTQTTLVGNNGSALWSNVVGPIFCVDQTRVHELSNACDRRDQWWKNGFSSTFLRWKHLTDRRRVTKNGWMITIIEHQS